MAQAWFARRWTRVREGALLASHVRPPSMFRDWERDGPGMVCSQIATREGRSSSRQPRPPPLVVSTAATTTRRIILPHITRPYGEAPIEEHKAEDEEEEEERGGEKRRRQMSNSNSQQLRRGDAGERREGGAAAPRVTQELPIESSPYVKYSDLEDYKSRGYGTEGHLEPVDNQPSGGGGTDAPTISGSGLSEGQAKAADALHRKGATA